MSQIRKRPRYGSGGYRPRASSSGVRPMSMGGRSFAPTPRVSALVPETKYFDTGISATVNWAGNTWASSEVPCDNYVNASGTAAAYTDSALIPSASGS